MRSVLWYARMAFKLHRIAVIGAFLATATGVSFAVHGLSVSARQAKPDPAGVAAAAVNSRVDAAKATAKAVAKCKLTFRSDEKAAQACAEDYARNQVGAVLPRR